jgi:hypothetical protein
MVLFLPYACRMMDMQRQRIKSKILHSVGYSLFNGILHVEFKQPPRVYDFYNVPVKVYIGFMNSSSKVKYFNKYIIGQFPFDQDERGL